MKRSRLFKVFSLTALVALAVSIASGCAPAADAGAAAGGDAAAASNASMIIMIVIMVAIFYFLMIRPENKRKKKAQELRDNVAVGDTITTIGGITGKVVHVNDNAIVIETSEDRVRIQLMKWSISSVGKQTQDPQK